MKFLQANNHVHFLFNLFGLLLTLTQANLSKKSSQFIINNLRFTNDSFTGYLSENVARPSLPLSLTQQSNRHNRNIKHHNFNSNNQEQRSSTIYVRFVDKVKPAIYFDSRQNFTCSYYTNKYTEFNFELFSEYDSEALSLFELDKHSFECFNIEPIFSCICYLKLRLIDDTAREKLNREAKDVYFMQIRSTLSIATTTLYVNILDDNDLEPMFDTSEYNIELNEITVLPEFSVIGRVSASDPDLSKNALVRYYLNCDQTQFTINKNCNKYFGVNWMSGEIYLKKSLDFIFSLNYSEFQFEINAIDSGLKMSLATNLLKLNETIQSYVKPSNEEDTFEDMDHKLIDIAADSMLNSVHALNRSYSSLVSSGFTRLEAANVRIKLVRQQKIEIESKNFQFIKLSSIGLPPIDLSEHISYRIRSDPTRVPFAILNVHQEMNIRKIKIRSTDINRIDFKIQELYLNKYTYLVSFILNSELIDAIKSPSKTFDFIIEYNGLSLNEFRFDPLNDFLNIVKMNCLLTLSGSSSFKVGKETSVNATLFEVRSTFKSIFLSTNHMDYCENFLSYRLNDPTYFHVEYSILNSSYFFIDSKTGIVKSSQNFHYLEETIKIEAILYFGTNQKILINQKEFKYNLTDQNNFVAEFMRANPANNIAYLHIKWQSGQQQHRIHLKNVINRVAKILYCSKLENCPFFLDKINGSLYLFNSNSSLAASMRTDLLIRLKDPRNEKQVPSYLSIQVSWPTTIFSSNTLDFENKDCFIGVQLLATNSSSKSTSSSKFYTSINNNYLDKPIKLIEMQLLHSLGNNTRKYIFSLKVQNEYIDNQCFYAEDQWVYLKCKLPFSVLKQFYKNKIEFTHTISRVLNIKVEDKITRKIAQTQLTVLFSINELIQRIEDVSVNISILNCTVPYKEDDSKIDQLNIHIFDNLVLNDNIHRIKSLTDTYLDTNATFSNKTHLSIVYLISSARLASNTPIWQLKSFNEDELCSFRLVDNPNGLFKVENGLLTSTVDWNVQWQYLADNYKYTIKLNLDCFKVQSYNLTVDVIFSLDNFAKINFTLNDIPTPMLENKYYELNLNVTKLEGSDLLLIKKFEMFLIYNSKLLNDVDILTKLFNISYGIKQLDIFDYAELPFYVDPQRGQLFFFSSSTKSILSQVYEFQVVVNFQFLYKENLNFNLSAFVKVAVESIEPISLEAKNNLKEDLISGSIDFSLSVTSTDLLTYLKCPLIAHFKFNNKNRRFKLLMPTQSSMFRNNSKTQSKKSSIFYHANRTVHKNVFKYSSKTKKQTNKVKIQRNNKRSMDEYVFEYKNSSLRSKRNLGFNVNNHDYQNNEDESQNEMELLYDTFYSQLYLDDRTGALYFNLGHSNDNLYLTAQGQQQFLYAKIAKLVNYYYYKRNILSKTIKIDAVIDQENNITDSIWINLIFNHGNQIQTSLKTTNSFLIENDLSLIDRNLKNKFIINSNNLLDLFHNGDEFIVEINIEENSPTWLALDDYDVSVNEGQLINIRKYFESSIDKNKNIINRNILNKLRYYALDNEYFKIDDIVNGIVLTKPSIQFDFEVERSYFTSIMIVQYLNNDEIDLSPTITDSTESYSQKFVYWLDLHINVVNIVDEPFVCSEPVYYISIDENEVKSKKLFTLSIIDYDSSTNAKQAEFIGQILTGNAQGLFEMNGLSLYTGSSSRKLDRETRVQHELEVKITEILANSSIALARFATCKIVVNVNDINDNRPILNAVDLVIYNKLDTRLVIDMNLPIANAIAIDPDQISKLTYSMLSVKIINNDINKKQNRRHRQPKKALRSNSDYQFDDEEKQQQSDKELNNYFRMNSTHGYLYATKTEMPCVDCIIQIQYKADDIGRLKTRVSRKRSIKLTVKSLPLSLFKINDDITEQTLASTDEQYKKTFELDLSNYTQNGLVKIFVNEDTKIGEKIYKLNIKSYQNSYLTQNVISTSITYFSLLDEGNFNQTFYLANHDGSLYLIKQLDFESEFTVYNLTVLVTNWVGQIEYIKIQVNVRDINDNLPKFEKIIYNLNYSLIMNENAENKVNLMIAHDLDQIDIGKLTFKIEDCFYLSNNILLKKPYVPSIGINPTTNHLNYPLCSKQFIELNTEDHNINHKNQLLKLKIHTLELKSYLRNLSDFFISNRTTISSIEFHMDISVKDSSMLGTSVSRVNFKFNLVKTNESVLRLKRELMAKSTISYKFGFKQPKYFIEIDSLNKLKQGAEIMRLNDEFVWMNETGHLNMFKPFSLLFYTVNQSFFSIEPSFGLIYLNKTLLDLQSVNHLGEKFIFEIRVYCRPKPNADNYERLNDVYGDIQLYRTAKITFSIIKSILYKQIKIDEIIFRPIWLKTHEEVNISENVPGGSFIEKFKASDLINMVTLEQIKNLTVFSHKLPILNYFIKPSNDYFELEPNSGHIRTRIGFEPDYEHKKFYVLNILACLTQTNVLFNFKTNIICLEQELRLRINIINRNDNEPILKQTNSDSNEFNLNLFNTSELIRSMSLFEFEVDDLDGNMTDLKYKILQVVPHSLGSYCDSYLNDIKFNVESFELYDLNIAKVGLKLSEIGYDNLIKLLEKHSDNTHVCIFSIEIVCQANDDLFTNRISFVLNIRLKSHETSLLSIKDNIIVPILHTVELDENVHKTKLVNISQILINYLHINLNHSIDDENNNNDESHEYLNDDKIIKFQLKNYQDLFKIEGNFLYVKNESNFDRELIENYELFIDIQLINENSLLFKEKHLIPLRFRILVKIHDVNDNMPVFYSPAELKLSKLTTYNRTYKWEAFLYSNRTHPLCQFKASDADLGINSAINYSILGSNLDEIFEINTLNGEIYSNQRLNLQSSKNFWAQYQNENNDLIIFLYIKASDSGETVQFNSTITVRLHFIWSHEDLLDVFFQQTFYIYSIPESIETHKIFGRVDSALYFNSNHTSNIIYSIIDGDPFDEFEIDYRTGELSPRVTLDYERCSSYYLIIKAYDSKNLNRGQHSNTTVKIDIIDINDNPPQFDYYEYKLQINENIAKMSELFKLDAFDIDAPNTSNSQIRYKLLNNFDKFYINELTGIVYNKISFDYETIQSGSFVEPGQLYSTETFESISLMSTNFIQLNIVAYDLGDSPIDLGNNQTYIGKSLETMCVLTINILNLNDVPPQFEKSVYFSQIEIDEEDLNFNSKPNSMLDLLLDNTTSKTSNNSFQFVTKVNAKDIDSTNLTYSIVKQTEVEDSRQHLAAENLFFIEPYTGIVYLNLRDYMLLKEFYNEINVLKFELQLAVSDSLFTSNARLTIQVKSCNDIKSSRPKFKQSLIKLNFNFKTIIKLSSLPMLDLRKQLSESFGKKNVEFSIGLDKYSEIFYIDKYILQMNLITFLKQNFESYIIYNIPIIACDQIQSGLCDQMIVMINFTDLSIKMDSSQLQSKSNNRIETYGFAYNYWAITIQQQSPAISSVSNFAKEDLNTYYDSSTTEDEEYYMDENYESNERFYFDIKIKDLSNENDYSDIQANNKKSKYEFELASCFYTGLNVTFSNISINKQIKQLNNGQSLPSKQLRSLFSLNKHNGVLSSRKIINTILPGMYSFDINLRSKSTNKTKSLTTDLIDSMQLRLIIIPSINSLQDKTQKLYNYFKFDKEFYKFQYKITSQTEFTNLGTIKLINRYANLKSNSKLYNLNILPKFDSSYFTVNFKLISSKFSNMFKLNDLFDLNEQTGLLRIKNKNLTYDFIKTELNEDFDLTLYALASVELENNNLEYMCEIQIDFKSLVSSQQNNQLKNIDSDIKFGKEIYQLKINANTKVESVIYKFLVHSNKNISYSLNNEYFTIDSMSGDLKLVKSLNSSINFNVTACDIINTECGFTKVFIQLIDSNNNPPEFERNVYEGTIREDALPGTVIKTVKAFDSKDRVINQKIDYFILDGDKLNQFAISSDGKVYTRLLIDREQIQTYSFTILAFDGKYKSITKLNVIVLDVDDNRPECSDNFVKLRISESVRIDTNIFNIKAKNPDSSKALIYEVITNEHSINTPLRIPFSVSEHGNLRTNSILDFEQENEYFFYVRVSKANEHMDNKMKSNSLQCLIKFQVNLIDENDNKPVFNQSNYVSELVENSLRGSMLVNSTSVFAFDPDSKFNGIVRYSLLNHTDLFNIDSKSGLITLNTMNFDRESIGDWLDLTIRAADSSLFTECKVSIHILDINDNRPTFERDLNYITIQENSPLGFLIMRLSAIDRDLNSITEYYLVNQTDSEKFSINKITGDVYVNEKLDFELKNQFIIQIVAIDPELDTLNENYIKNNGSVTKLIIDLLDINDNSPQFHILTPLNLSVNENTPVNTTLHIFKATDMDMTNQNNELKFQIIDGNQFGFFEINEKNGRFYIKKEYDYESLDIHDFQITIECSDNGEPIPLKNKINITINFKDLNDNKPEYTRKNQTIIFKESYPLGQEITKLLVTDLDELNGGAPFTFAIIEQFRNLVEQNFDEELQVQSLVQLVEPIFGINPNGSLILIKKPFSNQTYFVRVRCYDSGIPSLYSDTFLTIKVTDESSNEPTMNSTQIDIITVGNTKIFDSETIVKIEPDQFIAKLKAYDADNDVLYYDLEKETTKHHRELFYINKLNGFLHSREGLIDTAKFELKATISDKKFLTVSNISVNVENINKDCMVNSLFIKLNFRCSNSSNEEFTIDKLASYGYIKRFKDTVIRLINYQKLKTKNNIVLKQNFNYTKLNVLIASLKVNKVAKDENTFVPSEIFDDTESDDDSEENSGFYQESVAGSNVEIIFSIQSDTGECLDAMFISKLLSKRKTLLVKKVKALNGNQSPFKIRIIDFLYNQECTDKQNLITICTTNVAFQNCKLKFNGYNEPESLCENDSRLSLSKCLLIPKHEWICENAQTFINNKLPRVEEILTTTTANKLKTNQLPKSLSDLQLKKYGQSCRKPYNPCKNNAICKQVKVASRQDAISLNSKNYSKIKVKIHCFCPNGFKGRFCEEDIDECSENEQLLINQQLNSKIKVITQKAVTEQNGPCIDNAQCINTHGSYLCNCSNSASCYNTQSPQYQHLSSEANKRLGHYKYSNYHYTIKKGENYVDDDEESIDDVEILDQDDNESDIESSLLPNDTLFSNKISNSVIRQALFGLFGGISAILVILSLGAGIACKINMNHNQNEQDRNRRNSLSRHDNKFSSDLIDTTNLTNENVGGVTSHNSSEDNDVSSVSSASSPRSNHHQSHLEREEHYSKSYGIRRFNRNNKQRSSQTASLLSSTSTTENFAMTSKKKTQKYKSKNFSIKNFNKENNLLLIESYNQPTSEQQDKKPKHSKFFNILGKIRFNASNHKLNEIAYKNPTILEEDTKMVINDLKTNKNLLSSCESHGGSSSLCESLDTYSSASSPYQQVKSVKEVIKTKSNLSVVESTSFQDTTANKSDCESESESGQYQIKPQNKDLNSFGQKKKFNTLRMNQGIKLETINLFKYNTASKATTGLSKLAKATIIKQQTPFSSSVNSITNNLSSFKSRNNDETPKKQNYNGDKNNDSINGPEDCSQGFYWDITDWNGGIASIDPKSMQKLNNSQTINTKLNIITANDEISIEQNYNDSIQSTLDFSPIYSKNFKTNKNETLTSFKAATPAALVNSDDDIESTQTLKDYQMSNLNAVNITNNYMYLFNADDDVDCDSNSNYYESSQTNDLAKKSLN